MRRPDELRFAPPAELAPLEAGTLVIGDLHLDPAGEPRIEGFLEWLRRNPAPSLVVLGDLFEVWVGPAQARLAGASLILAELSAWTARGFGLEVVPGNRDFLLGEAFTGLTGGRLHPHGFRAQLPGSEDHAIFVHGDELCTQDLAYQRLKRVLRSGPVRLAAKAAPLALARWAAGRLRAASVRAVAQKPAPEKSMQASACRELCARTHSQALVCGHAHAFRDDRLDDGPRWLVLDAWGDERDVLELTDMSFRPRSSAAARGEAS